MLSPRLTILSVLVMSLTAAAIACGQDAPPGVRLGLSYPRGTVPTVVVMPVDGQGGDSVRAIIHRDLDFSDRIRPLILDDAALGGLIPVSDGAFNYALFSRLSAAAIIAAKRIPGGFRVALYDVAAKKQIRSSDFPLPAVPQPREGFLRDSVISANSTTDPDMREAVALRFRDQALARHPLRKDDRRKRRFIVRDSISRDSAITAEVSRDLSEWERARADTVSRRNAPIIRELIAADSATREKARHNVRMAVHGIADAVEGWITGRRGIAQTRVLYVHGGRIRVIDSDGENDRPVTEPGLSLSPAWSPDGRSVVYSTFTDRGSQIAVADLETRRSRLLSATPTGLNITPVFTPDGSRVVYSTGYEKGTNLVIADLRSGLPAVPLTVGDRGENASPTFSPDGRRIGFLSSRARYPQIYSIDTDGTDIELVTPYPPGIRSYRTAPDWSPDGRAIAYEQQNGDFQVWMITLRTKVMRRLTSVGENEGPSWAPDGRHMAITSTRGGSRQIWILDTETGRFRQLTRNAGARLAAWSPVIRSIP